ncbi:rhomboid family intramembrane serine protease [bacterium]|nr:rhomboid family intramembrane serine protease [bacterium]MCP5462527.1 rhomboid family intramembrane serine protease [bacterium]
MIPIRDNNPSSKIPYVTYSIIGINIFIFILELIMRKHFVAGDQLGNFFLQFGIVPTRYSNREIAQHYIFIEQLIPFFTSMFLHGGWIHIIGNMWTLYIFGDNVEDFLGHGKYLVFYIVCGVLSGLFHLLTNLNSHIPTIGASGAIAGIMGAYIILYPHARVLVILPIFLFVEVFEVSAYFFLGFWFIIQFFNGTFSLGTASLYGGVAWWAHIGGFIAGLLIILSTKRYHLSKKTHRYTR